MPRITRAMSADLNGGLLPAGFGSTKNSEGGRDIGRFAGADFEDYFNGAIDEVRLYNRASPPGDVASVYAFEAGQVATFLSRRGTIELNRVPR